MDVHHPTVKTMIAWGARFARRAILRERPFPWVIFSGESGCGKSRLARRASRIIRETAVDAWAGGIWPKPPTVVFSDWPRLCEIKDQEDYEEAARDLREADVIALDDLGAETDRFRSGEPLSRLRRLLSDLEGKAVIITTNLRSTEWAAKWDGRIESRLSIAKHLDCFDVPDYRPMVGSKPVKATEVVKGTSA